MIRNNKKGNAIVIVLVISSVLLVIGLSDSKLTKKVDTSTTKIDEHVRLQYLADGLAQIVLLKYKKYPADFYDAWLGARAGNEEAVNALRAFTSGADEFNQKKFVNKDDQPSSLFSINKRGNFDNMVKLSVISMDLRTTVNERWSEDVLTIVTGASYRDSLNHDVTAQSTLTVVVSRQPTM